MIGRRVKASPRATMATRGARGETTLSTPVTMRGAAKINGKTWSFISGGYYILATQRPVIPAKGPGPGFATESVRAAVEAMLTAPVVPVSTCGGKALRDLAHFATKEAVARGEDGLPMVVGGGVFNICELATPAVFARPDERVTIARSGETLRIDGESFRFVLMRLGDDVEPIGEIGNPADLGAFAPKGDA